MSGLLVSPDWLKAGLGTPSLKVVDGSWYLPAQNRDARAEFLAGHIPGAVFFDIDRVADPSTALPHMLPDADTFAAAAGALGLAPDDTIVVYDGAGLFSAPRVWWTLRVFGARDVRILDGGLPAWRAAALPLEAGEPQPAPSVFPARLDAGAVRDYAAVAALLDSGREAIVDARPAGRFAGTEPEPRPGLPSGHMPGACNVPIDRLVDASGRLRPPDEVAAIFCQAGIDLSRPVVTTCGSGVTAALLLFALATIGKTDVALYDGSWTEWASRPESRIARGAA